MDMLPMDVTTADPSTDAHVPILQVRSEARVLARSARVRRPRAATMAAFA